jgi:hypothetical protein
VPETTQPSERHPPSYFFPIGCAVRKTPQQPVKA